MELYYVTSPQFRQRHDGHGIQSNGVRQSRSPTRSQPASQLGSASGSSGDPWAPMPQMMTRPGFWSSRRCIPASKNSCRSPPPPSMTAPRTRPPPVSQIVLAATQREVQRRRGVQVADVRRVAPVKQAQHLPASIGVPLIGIGAVPMFRRD
jgi:hypothetical protein